MDLHRHYRGALVCALTLMFVGSTPAWADKTLWLVRPLYPGQETLVDRTEKALDKLMPADARQDSVIGQKELAAAFKGRVPTELPCFSAESRCTDPIDPFVASLGFERIVLIQGGQDEAGFKFRVAAYEPKTGKVSPASASNANLEKALLGAVAKVVPAASTLEVKSTPPGATVYVDDVKVGTTPLNTQVLPGERVIRLDLKLHQPVEETIVIPIRGSASLEKTLDKVAARIVITASPPGTEIFLDGTSIGKDKIDRGIAPGDHTIRLTAENHKAFEQTVSVKADQQYSLDKTLEPVPGAGGLIVPMPLPGKPEEPKVKPQDVAVVVRADPPPPTPPKPSSPEDLIYEKRSYFDVSFEVASLIASSPAGATLVGRRLDRNAFGRTHTFIGNAPTLVGVSAEYGTFGKYFGVTIFGLSWLTNIDDAQMNVGFEPTKMREAFSGVQGPRGIRNVRMNLGVVRALQPQFRVAFWKFQFSVQVGLEFRSGQIIGPNRADPDHPEIDPAVTSYDSGFLPLDLLVSGRLNLRFFIAEGFFMHLQGNYSQIIIGEKAFDDVSGKTFGSSSSAGANLGVGYAF